MCLDTYSISPVKRENQENIFLISPSKHMLWYSLEACMFTWKNKKNINYFWLEKAPYLELCYLSYFHLKYMIMYLT